MATSPIVQPNPADAVPPLRAGDRLTRAEFERRWDAMPDLKRAELIEGVVYMPSPLRFEAHAEPHSLLMMWLTLYAIHTPGTRCGDNGSVRLDDSNEPQPDGMLFIQRGGQARIDTDDYVSGAPELVVEVAASSISHDLNVKLPVYRRHGVREYILWRVPHRQIDWFILRDDGQYHPLPPSSGGVRQSETFPGLWLDGTALLAGDLMRVYAILQQGLAGPEHAAFVVRLQAGRSTPPADPV